MDRNELLRRLAAEGITDQAVLAAMARVPRQEFVREEDRAYAWQDTPLPIGSGQTISQPFVVAWMVQWAGVAPGHTVLDVGTGCGYQAAVLAELGADVVSIEIRAELARAASTRLNRLGYTRVRVVLGDGRAGVAESAPYDCIIVAAAADDVPESLLDQLRPPDRERGGGRLVIPLEGGLTGLQRLVLVERTAQGFQRTEGLAVRFVPLIWGTPRGPFPP